MCKHIIGQAIYQLTILLILIFSGDKFLPEYGDSFDDEIRLKKYPISYKYKIIGKFIFILTLFSK